MTWVDAVVQRYCMPVLRHLNVGRLRAMGNGAHLALTAAGEAAKPRHEPPAIGEVQAELTNAVTARGLRRAAWALYRAGEFHSAQYIARKLLPAVARTRADADIRLVELCGPHIKFDLADIATRLEPSPSVLVQAKNGAGSPGGQSLDGEVGTSADANGFLVDLMAGAVPELGAGRLVRNFLSLRSPPTRADIATVQELIKKLRQQKRLEATRDVAEAFMKVVPGRTALRLYLHALDSLGDDKAIEAIVERPDIARIANDDLDPFVLNAKMNTLARIRLKFECSRPRSLPPRPLAEAGSRRVGYFVHNSLPFASGGYAIRTHGVAQAIAAGGHAGRVFTRAGFPGDLGGAKVLDLSPKDVESIAYEFTDRPQKSRFVYRYIEEAAKAYEAIIRSHSIEIAHAASNFQVALPVALAARRQGIPFVYEVRGFWDLTRASRDPTYLEGPEARRNNTLEQLCLGLAHAVVTLNGKMVDRLLARDVEQDSIFVVPNCVNPEHFEPREKDQALRRELGISDSDVVVGYVGSFVGYEGIDDLLRAFELMRREVGSAKLLLVGDDRPLQVTYRHSIGMSIRDLAEELGIEKDVIFTGRVPFAKVAEYYSLIDLCPFPRTRHEVCQVVSPLKPLEAMSMNKCVLVSDVGGMDDIVEHGVTGWRFESENVAALAAALVRLAHDTGLRTSLADGGRKWVEENRTWSSTGAQLTDAYSYAVSVLRKNQSRRSKALSEALAAY